MKCWGSGNLGQLGSQDHQDIGDEPNEMGEYLNAVNLGETFGSSELLSYENSSISVISQTSTVCPSGSELSNDECLMCQTGKHRNREEHLSCQNCEIGKHSKSYGMKSCDPCDRWPHSAVEGCRRCRDYSLSTSVNTVPRDWDWVIIFLICAGSFYVPVLIFYGYKPTFHLAYLIGIPYVFNVCFASISVFQLESSLVTVWCMIGFPYIFFIPQMLFHNLSWKEKHENALIWWNNPDDGDLKRFGKVALMVIFSSLILVLLIVASIILFLLYQFRVLYVADRFRFLTFKNKIGTFHYYCHFVSDLLTFLVISVILWANREYQGDPYLKAVMYYNLIFVISISIWFFLAEVYRKRKKRIFNLWPIGLEPLINEGSKLHLEQLSHFFIKMKKSIPCARKLFIKKSNKNLSSHLESKSDRSSKDSEEEEKANSLDETKIHTPIDNSSSEGMTNDLTAPLLTSQNRSEEVESKLKNEDDGSFVEDGGQNLQSSKLESKNHDSSYVSPSEEDPNSPIEDPEKGFQKNSTSELVGGFSCWTFGDEDDHSVPFVVDSLSIYDEKWDRGKGRANFVSITSPVSSTEFYMKITTNEQRCLREYEILSHLNICDSVTRMNKEVFNSFLNKHLIVPFN